MSSGGARAGEGDQIDIGSDQRLTLGAIAVNHLQHPFGKMFHQQVGVGLGDQWRLLRWFQDHRVARHQCRDDGPVRHRQGKVPRRDSGTDTQRIEDQRRADIFIVDRFRSQRFDHFIEGLVERGSTMLRLADPLGQRFSHLAGEQGSQLVCGLYQCLAEGAQLIGALLQRQLRPARLCRPSGRDHRGDLLRCSDGESTHFLTGGWIE